MKFDQLTEYNMKNIFLEKSNTKWGAGESSFRTQYMGVGKLVPDPFIENEN